MRKVISGDGTPIAYETVGSGPPLVMVHGSTGSRARWGSIVQPLAENFTIVLLDRRGRGDSGDGSDYAIEREFEDVAAVVDALDGPVNLLGHSFGAICALEAALLTDSLRKLVLYEPPLAAPHTPAAVEEQARLDTMLEAGDREGVLTAFLQHSVGVPPEAIEQMRQSRTWMERIAIAHTIPRERQAVMEYSLDPSRFRALATPTLLMLGGDSPPVFVESTRLVQAALPACTLIVMTGQQHAAMDTAPDLFVREVKSFLNGSSSA